jgi:hypothetical protein
MIAAILLLFGCGSAERVEREADDARNAPINAQGAGAPEAPAPGEPPLAETAAEFEGTAGVVERLRPGAATAVLRDVRVAGHEGFDRVVFEFEGAAVPGYHVEYVDRPVRQCGSGDAVPVAGDGWLLVRLTPAQAHTDEGEPTAGPRERRVGLTNLKEVESICDFEGEVAWVLGVGSPNRYRVLELSGPARLVVDVRH